MASHLVIAGLFCILILSAGCTAVEKGQNLLSSSPETDEMIHSYERSASAPEPAMAGTTQVSKTKDSGTRTGYDLSAQDQKIIRTADIRLEVTDVRRSAEEIARIADSVHGVIQSSSVTAGVGNQYTGAVTIRVPSEAFEGAISRVVSLGRLTSSSVSAEDVTEEYVDLTAQKNALDNQLSQYNRILSLAVNVSEILEVQKEIERVQVELDRISGRMQYLDSRISFSTITIRMSEPAAVVTSTGISAAAVISDGISGFIDTVAWLVVMIMTLLPLGIIGLAGYALYRRMKKPGL